MLTDFFVGQLADARAGLDAWRARRNEFLNQEKFFGTEETSKFLLNKIGLLEARLTQLNGDVSSQNMRAENLRLLTERSGPELESELSFSMSQNFLQSSIVQNIKFSLQQLNLRREELMQKYTDKHPDLLAVNQQIADLQAAAKARGGRLRTGHSHSRTMNSGCCFASRSEIASSTNFGPALP